MTIQQLAERAQALIRSQLGDSAQSVQPLPGLTILKYHHVTAFESSLYQPAVCLILQGRKETLLGEQTFKLGVGDCLLISHDVPVVARIKEAPGLAVLFDVELGALRSLYDEVADAASEAAQVQTIEVRKAEEPVVNALLRYLALAGSATDAKVLGPMIAKEIHYRLLMSPFGGMLRSLLRYDSHASAIARAIAHIRRDFRRQLVIPDLARSVGMSATLFHQQFRAITSCTPLQYQKELRLLEAKRLLFAFGTSVSTAAYDVGYESPNQFSREYARKFGVPPSKDQALAAERSKRASDNGHIEGADDARGNVTVAPRLVERAPRDVEVV
jgi:AraC-like DNA-binding protein